MPEFTFDLEPFIRAALDSVSVEIEALAEEKVADVLRGKGWTVRRPHELERRVRFLTGYDHREGSPIADPAKANVGAHDMEIEFALVGKDAAVSWRLNTGWMRFPLRRGLLNYEGRRDEPGLDGVLWDRYPRGIAVSSHTRVDYLDLDLSEQDCHLIGRCYGDSSYLGGTELLRTLVGEGEEAMWDALNDWYRSMVTEPHHAHTLATAKENDS